MKIAYMMSRFPKLTETFVAFEIIEQERRGIEVLIFPLLRQSVQVTHAEVDPLVSKARFQPFFSSHILRANTRFMLQEPRRYFAALVEALLGTVGNMNFFIGAIGIFPKTVAFAAEMKDAHVQHIHAHFATHPALAALIIHRLTGIPFSFTLHGSDLHKDQRMLARKLRAAQFAVTVSRFNKRFIADTCGEAAASRVLVVHCGVDTEYFRPAIGLRRPGPLRIVCVASFEEVKGHKYLISACDRLRAAGVDFECRLIGDGPLRPQIEQQIAAARLDRHCRILGPLPRHEVRNALWGSDVSVLASVPTSSGQREGIPVALMEAMACGLPVIASEISGIPELIDSGISGLLVPPGQSDAIADKLQLLHQRPDFAQSIGNAARAQILSNFDSRRNADRLAAIFRAFCYGGRMQPRHTTSTDLTSHATSEQDAVSA
jgi:colanic acid/amylovoran biosynthesis glycosyltransferase